MSEDFSEARARAAAIAARALAGIESPILASRELSDLRFQVGVPDDDPDFRAFVSIDSETDALPVGKARARWAEEVLVQMAPEIARSQEWAMNHGREAFENVVRRFGIPE